MCVLTFINSILWMFFIVYLIYIVSFCKSCDADSALGFYLFSPFIILFAIIANFIGYIIIRRNNLNFNHNNIFVIQLPLSSSIIFSIFSIFSFEIITRMYFSDTFLNYILFNIIIITLFELIVYFFIHKFYNKYIL